MAPTVYQDHCSAFYPWDFDPMALWAFRMAHTNHL